MRALGGPEPPRQGRADVARFVRELGGLGGAQPLRCRSVNEPSGLPGRDSVQHLVHVDRSSERPPE
jgi:hypothetical protein